ncbi:hypothetical protein EV214_10726 [Marinisporobacter balticus]|uniref:MatE protein n=1 Tax=Marinisporobacter balticus TaxID=2018667 RepID=A0A4V2SBU0_9FIRM|nr:hypothetical protein EV214_10726 [Marinisporobacter balticus]
MLLVFLLGNLVSIFTNLENIIELSNQYIIWLVVFPFVIGIGLVYYGIFTGATYTLPIKNSMIISLIVFLAAYFIAIPKFKNHGLWFAFIIFSFGRSMILWLYRKDLFNKLFVSNND